LGRVVLLVLHFSRKGGNIAHRKIAVGTKPAWLRLGTTVWQIQPAYSGCSCQLQLLPPKPAKLSSVYKSCTALVQLHIELLLLR